MSSNISNGLSSLDIPVYGALPPDIAQVTANKLPYSNRTTHLPHEPQHNHHNTRSSTAQTNALYNQQHGNPHLDPSLASDSASPYHDSASSSAIEPHQPGAHNGFDMLHPVVATHPSFNYTREAQQSPPSPHMITRPDLPPPPPPIEASPSGEWDMLPPPPSTHPTFTALHEYAQRFGAAHGYALSINTTAKNRLRIKLACVCYGQPKNTHKLTPETRVRKNRQSAKTGCKMWVEGKKMEDGSWVLRVGEGRHNHGGRAVEGWAGQRKRTWRVGGGRVGVGGVTAREEREREGVEGQLRAELRAAGGMVAAEECEGPEGEELNGAAQEVNPSHSLENGGLVWRIVEQEMLKKSGPGQGRDRGVGRTVKVLEERLPGISIFKRDVYNIRAQIKRARKLAGQEIGEGLDDGDAEVLEQQEQEGSRYPEIDPVLVAQCNDALRNASGEQEEEGIREVEALRREVEMLRRVVGDRDKELEETRGENQQLRAELDVVRLGGMYRPATG